MPAVTTTGTPPRLAFSLPLDPARLLRARQRIRDYLHEQRVAPDIIDPVVVAIEEAMTNAVRHSGAEEELEVGLHFDGRDLIAEVRDRGQGFDAAAFDVGETPDLLAPGGRGLFLMAKLMDRLELHRDGGIEVRAVMHDALRQDPDRPPKARRPRVTMPGEGYWDARHQALLDDVDERVAAFDWEYRYVFANKALLAAMQRPRTDVLGRTVWEVFPNINGTPQERALRDAMELGKSSVLEHRSLATDEWLESRIYPTASGISFFSRDITERKIKELERDELFEALRESEERFETMFEKSPFALALTKMPERITIAVNAALERLLGFDRAELLGHTTMDLGITDAASQDEVSAKLAADGLVHDFECRRTTKSGEQRWVSLNIDPITVRGEPHLLSTLQDVTERRRAEEARGRFELLVANSRDIILFMERDGHIVDANRAAERAYGYTRDELLKMTVADLRAESTAAEIPSQMSEADERGILFESVHRCKDGSVFPVEVSSRGATIAGRRMLVSLIRDVTERKRAEEATRAKDEQWRHLTRCAPAGIYEIDFRGPRFVTVNDFMCAYSGYSREELLAKSPFELLDEESQARFKERILKTLAGETVDTTVEYGFITKGGEQRWTVLNVTPSFEDGKPVGAFVVGYDVTDRRRAEAALRESESLLRAVTDNSPDAIYVKDTESRWVMANPAVLRIVGRTSEEALGKTDLELYDDPEIGEAILANDRRIMETGEAEVFEEAADTPNGRRTFVSVKAPRRDASGRITGIVGISHDITERKQAEEERDRHLRDAMEEHRRLQAVLSSVPTALWVVDAAGKMVYVNDHARTLWGGQAPAAESIDGYSVYKIWSAETGEPVVAEQMPLARALRGETTVALEVNIERFDGSRGTWLVSARPVRSEGVIIGAVAAVQDVSERKRAEEALRESEELFRSFVEASSDVVYRMSPDWHEMRQLKGRQFISDTDDPSDVWLDTYIHPDDQPRVLAAIDAAIGTKSVFDLEHRVRQMDGSLGWTHSRAAPRLDADGEIIEWVGTASDITESKRAQLAREDAGRLGEALNAIDALVHSSLRTDEVVQTALREGAQAIGADHAGLSLHEDESQGFRVAYVHNHPPDKVGVLIPDSEDIHGVEAMRTGKTLAIHDTQTDPRVVRRLMAAWRIRSVICAPLVVQGKPIGVVYYSYCSNPHSFSEAEVDFMGRLASSLSTAVENAALYEAQRHIAVTLQEAFMHVLPTLEGLDLGIAGLTASQPALVGGDFWDLYALPDNKVMVVMGDVAGKGIQATALTETVHSTMRAFATVDDSPAFIMRKTNDLLLADEAVDSFVTALVLVLDLGTGKAKIASAGHPGPVRVGEGTCATIDPDYRPPLGAFPTEYPTTDAELMPGDYLVLYTDGMTEARRDGELFGEERLRATLAALWGKSAQDVADRLAGAASTFGDTLKDDLEVLVLRRR